MRTAALWVLVPLVVGVVAVFLPCYLFPLFGASQYTWCGFKSAPRYAEIQFVIGALLGLVPAIVMRRR